MNKSASGGLRGGQTTTMSEEARAALRVLGAWALRAADEGGPGLDSLPDTHRDLPIGPAAHPRPRLLTILEASEQLRLSRWSVYQLINQRKLVSVKVASRRLVPATEIDRFIKQLVDGTGGPA